MFQKQVAEHAKNWKISCPTLFGEYSMAVDDEDPSENHVLPSLQVLPKETLDHAKVNLEGPLVARHDLNL